GRASCDDLAQAAAVLIAAWESELRSGAPLQPLRPLHARSAPSMRPDHPEAPLTAGPPRAVVWTTSAGFVASLAGGALAPGGSADLLSSPPGRGLAAPLGPVVTDPRDLQLGTGRASWTRLAFSLGARYRMAAAAAAATGAASIRRNRARAASTAAVAAAQSA